MLRQMQQKTFLKILGSPIIGPIAGFSAEAEAAKLFLLAKRTHNREALRMLDRRRCWSLLDWVYLENTA